MDSNLIVLVCGGRDYGCVPRNTPTSFLKHAKAQAKREKKILFDTLTNFHEEIGIKLLVQGFANGADKLAHAWACENGVKSTGSKYEVTPEMWRTQGRSAGHRRNADMYRKERPDVIIAFPGGKGTAGMVRIANSGETPVIEVTKSGKLK